MKNVTSWRLGPLFRRVGGLLVVFSLAACAHGSLPASRAAYGTTYGAELERGTASWYGADLHGRRTASGERFDMHELTAAHRSLPFGTRVLVRNPSNGRQVVVRINDRDPFKRGRVIDLSYAAARALGLHAHGYGPVVLHELR